MFFVFATTFVSITLAVTGLAQNVSPPNVGNYLVAIRVNNTRLYPTDEKWFNCGGSIIDNRFVITAANCFVDENNEFEKLHFTVLAGSKDLQERSEPTRVEVGVEKVYIPDNYDNRKFNPWNDIAVVKLNDSLHLENNHNLANLRLPDQAQGSEVGLKAVIAGYGLGHTELLRSYEDPIWNVIATENGKIHSGDVEIVNNSNCWPENNETLCIKLNTLDDEIIYDDDQEHCLSDAGGPLVYESSILIGVQPWMSYITCNILGAPEQYFKFVNVANHIDFIENAKKDIVENMRTHEY